MKKESRKMMRRRKMREDYRKVNGLRVVEC